MARHIATIGLVLLLAGCASQEVREAERLPVPVLTGFSAGAPGGTLPGGWRTWTVGKFKKATEYRLVSEAGGTVVKASARASASGLSHDLHVDPKAYPILRWRWKVNQLIVGADNTARNAEDSPVRLVVAFEGDQSKFSFDDRLFATQIRMLTGYELPYATLMYIWENRVPAGTVLPNHHTSRIRMIVAESGSRKLGSWQEMTRNLLEDYRRAFGEEPPRTRSIGIMTDTDNTGESTEAWYGDIILQRAAGRATRGSSAR